MIGVPIKYGRDTSWSVAVKLTAVLQGLVTLNHAIVSMEGELPSVLAGGVVYRREPRGEERWRSWDIIIADGYGDCEDLTGALATEWQLRGLPARAIVRPARTTRGYHAVVELWGQEFDPSAILIARELRGRPYDEALFRAPRRNV